MPEGLAQFLNSIDDRFWDQRPDDQIRFFAFLLLAVREEERDQAVAALHPLLSRIMNGLAGTAHERLRVLLEHMQLRQKLPRRERLPTLEISRRLRELVPLLRQ